MRGSRKQKKEAGKTRDKSETKNREGKKRAETRLVVEIRENAAVKSKKRRSWPAAPNEHIGAAKPGNSTERKGDHTLAEKESKTREAKFSEGEGYSPLACMEPRICRGNIVCKNRRDKPRYKSLVMGRPDSMHVVNIWGVD